MVFLSEHDMKNNTVLENAEPQVFDGLTSLAILLVKQALAGMCVESPCNSMVSGAYLYSIILKEERPFESGMDCS